VTISLKRLLKRITPNPVHRLYNRLISRWLIKQRYGKWFDPDWKQKATTASTEDWLKLYDQSWEEWQEPDLTGYDLQRIVELVPGGSTVLDVGCGDGYLLSAISHRASEMLGADISRTGLLIAEKRLAGATGLVQADCEKLPFADSSVDVVVSAHTIEHVLNPRLAITEMIRVARKRIVVLVPIQEYLPYTEDYHLQFFIKEEYLLSLAEPLNCHIERYQEPTGESKYQGEVFLMNADLEKI